MMKPIQTRYRGYRFRSRLEARWAVYFDAVGLEWSYEPEGYGLSDGSAYLPDFWLPQCNTWFEVKGQPPTPEEQRKLIQFARELPAPTCPSRYGLRAGSGASSLGMIA